MKHKYIVVVARSDSTESYLVCSSKPIVTAWDHSKLLQYMTMYICKEDDIVITDMAYIGEESNFVSQLLEDSGIKLDQSITFYDAVKV